LTFLAVCTGLALGARTFAGDTNAPPLDTNGPSELDVLVQIQAQIRTTQLAVEQSRLEAQQYATDAITRNQGLEEALAAQRTGDVESEQKNQQTMFMMAGGLGLAVVAAVLFMVYLLWRAVRRLVEMFWTRQAGLTAGDPRHAPSLVTGAVVADANTRLFGAVDQLQKRILELEQGSRAVLNGTKSASTDAGAIGATATATASNGHDDPIANLIADGQTLLNAEQPEKALRLFDEALAINPEHSGALVKRGGALEKLERFDEAVACYDRAIAAEPTATIAYLQKGGLFNRLARYDDALRCYEEALRSQERQKALAD
jgi:tetratricopeptide (TPR) repeat protein